MRMCFDWPNLNSAPNDDQSLILLGLYFLFIPNYPYNINIASSCTHWNTVFIFQRNVCWYWCFMNVCEMKCFASCLLGYCSDGYWQFGIAVATCVCDGTGRIKSKGRM